MVSDEVLRWESSGPDDCRVQVAYDPVGSVPVIARSEGATHRFAETGGPSDKTGHR